MSKNALEPAEYERVKKKVLSATNGPESVEEAAYKWLFRQVTPNIYNGYRRPNLARIGHMIQFFATQNKPFTTALNKLMFYADFCHFKQVGQSISGISYLALPMGPVPDKYGTIYDYIVSQGFAMVEEKPFKDFVGDQFFTDDSITPASSPFADSELRVLQEVSEKFKTRIPGRS